MTVSQGSKELSTSSVAKPEKGGESYVNSLGMKFAWIPPGTFTRGDPPHRVTLTKGYFMGVSPVTNELWRKVMGKELDETVRWPYQYCQHLEFAQGIVVSTAWPEMPVNYVSWFDCQAFIKMLVRVDAGRYCLPTDAQWEHASQGSLKWDMNTAMWEWCQDWFDHYPKTDVTDPLGPRSSPMNARFLRQSGESRNMMNPQSRAERFSFRLALLTE